MSNETKYQVAKENGNCKGPCVYVFTNRCMPRLIKIGKIETTTKSTAERADELYYSSTGVPMQFEVYYEFRCENPKRLEKLMHEHLAGYRVNPRREFFRFPADKAVELLKQLSNSPMCLLKAVELLNTAVLDVNLEDLELFGK